VGESVVWRGGVGGCTATGLIIRLSSRAWAAIIRESALGRPRGVIDTSGVLAGVSTSMIGRSVALAAAGSGK
jgi:hypothetical protein